jgi:putative toxin-antitoxin system antitoxin component (TIGR02293 family)
MTSEIVEALGGESRVRNPEEMRAWVREGLPFESLESVVQRFGLKREEVSWVLDLPERTLTRRRQEQRLRPAESDRLFRVTRIAVQAEQVLGSTDKAARWLHTENRALGGQTPLALLDTDLGTREVEEVLGRIEHGVFS